MPQLRTWLASSQDPNTVANTVKGFVLAGSSIIIFLGMQVFHITLSAGDVASLATEVSTLAGLVWAGYGIIMKLVVWFGQVKTQS